MDGVDDQAPLNRDSGPSGEANTQHRTASLPVPPRNFFERGFGDLEPLHRAWLASLGMPRRQRRML